MTATRNEIDKRVNLTVTVSADVCRRALALNGREVVIGLQLTPDDAELLADGLLDRAHQVELAAAE